jgi:myo-inositol-1(or 4)-monophosphatase
MNDLDRLRRLAGRAASAGGEVVRGQGPGGIELKGRADYVTEVDRAAERTIREALEQEAPAIPIVGEEYGGVTASEYWLVDPIDGTVNFMHGLPIVGVSVALVREGSPVAGAVHAPYLQTTWTSARGAGAEQDGRPIRVSDGAPETAVVGTGFPFRHKERLPDYLRVMLPALERFEDLRRPGAVALDLAWVASGVFDGFFELGLAPWDVAAGALLIDEAGGVITDWSGGRDYLAGDVLAGNGAIHKALLEIVGGGGGKS